MGCMPLEHQNPCPPFEGVGSHLGKVEGPGAVPPNVEIIFQPLLATPSRHSVLSQVPICIIPHQNLPPWLQHLGNIPNRLKPPRHHHTSDAGCAEDLEILQNMRFKIAYIRQFFHTNRTLACEGNWELFRPTAPVTFQKGKRTTNTQSDLAHVYTSEI